MKFYSTMGLEFTYLTQTNLFEEYRAKAYAYLVRADFEQSKLPFFNIGVDENALEISSRPFSDLGTAERFFKLMEKIVSYYPLVTHRIDTFSGGGHIHIGIPKPYLSDPFNLLLFLTNAFRDVTNRPYLSWIFNEFCNDTSAQSYATLRKHHDPNNPLFRKILFTKDPSIPIDWSILDILNCFGSIKSYACRVDTGTTGYHGHTIKMPTLEFRFFDAMRDWKTTEKHLKFADAYFRYLDSLTRKSKVVQAMVTSKDDIAWLAEDDRGLKKFWALLTLLGLKRSDYEVFVDRNYALRKEAKLLK